MKTVLVLCGGRSDEHEISLISAKGVLDALDRSQFQPLVVGISRQGKWHLENEKTFFEGEFRADRIRLNQNTPLASLTPFLQDGRGELVVDGKSHFFDVVFPILHGPFGEDGTLQGMLDITGVPYVGSGCASSAICMDKALMKVVCAARGIAMAPYVLLTDAAELPSQLNEINTLGYPLFVKPARLGSSVGITKVDSPTTLTAAVEYAFKYDRKVLIEKGIKGREIETAVLGLSRSARVACPGEVIPSPKVGWYSYDAKYLSADGATIVIPARLDAAMEQKVKTFSLHVFQTLECDGLARIDLFIEEGTQKIFLNEPNTMPGFTPISMYPKMWQASGLPYSELITELIQLAFLRQAANVPKS